MFGMMDGPEAEEEPILLRQTDPRGPGREAAWLRAQRQYRIGQLALLGIGLGGLILAIAVWVGLR